MLERILAYGKLLLNLGKPALQDGLLFRLALWDNGPDIHPHRLHVPEHVREGRLFPTGTFKPPFCGHFADTAHLSKLFIGHFGLLVAQGLKPPDKLPPDLFKNFFCVHFSYISETMLHR